MGRAERLAPVPKAWDLYDPTLLVQHVLSKSQDRLKAARTVLDASAGVAARKRVSQQQAEAVCATLLARAASLSATDLETVTELVDEVGFEVVDLTSVLDAISVVAGSLKRRRGAQTLHPQIHHYFTASEWRIMQNGVGNTDAI